MRNGWEEIAFALPARDTFSDSFGGDGRSLHPLGSLHSQILTIYVAYVKFIREHEPSPSYYTYLFVNAV